jgi:hypothetical protein
VGARSAPQDIQPAAVGGAAQPTRAFACGAAPDRGRIVEQPGVVHQDTDRPSVIV